MTTRPHPCLRIAALAAAVLLPLAASAAPVLLSPGGTHNSLGASVSDDGQRVVFYSASNLTGANADNNFEVFLYDRPSGSLRQVTNDPAGLFHGSQTPRISGDGSRIVFQSFEPAPNSISLFQTRSYDIASNSFTALTSPGMFQVSDINRDGTRISVNVDNLGLRVYDTTTGLFGAVQAGGVLSHALSGNGNVLAVNTFNGSLALRDLVAGTTTSILGNGSFESLSPAISHDGQRVAFTSSRNLLGQNADGNAELYLYDAATATLRQLTDTTGAQNRLGTMSSDGRRIAFSSMADPLGLNGDGNEEIFYVDLDDNLLRQATTTSGSQIFNFEAALSGDGRTLAYTATTPVGAGFGPMQIFLMDLPPLGQAVPEPPTWLLAASMLVFAGRVRRRSRQARCSAAVPAV